MGSIDRRELIKRASVAGAAAGAVWVAPSVLGSSAAFAAGSCIYDGELDWTAARAALGQQEPILNNTRTFTVQVPGVGGGPDVHIVVTVTPTNPNPGQGGWGASGAGQQPPTGQRTNGGINQDIGEGPALFNGYTSYYAISMRNQGANRGYNVKFDFYAGTTGTTPINVYNLKFRLFDIDAYSPSNGYIDQMYVTGSPTVLFKGSQVSGNGTSSQPWYGTSSNGVTDDTGTVEVEYGSPVTTVTASYRSGSRYGTHQTIGITNLTWCY